MRKHSGWQEAAGKHERTDSGGQTRRVPAIEFNACHHHDDAVQCSPRVTISECTAKLPAWPRLPG